MKNNRLLKKTPKDSLRQLVFIFGCPIKHSLSPLMHNAAFDQLGLPWVYIPLEISADQLGGAVGILRSFNAKGANVTVPYKEAVIPWLDYIEPEARWMKSVNTIYRVGNKLCGESTDGEGFLRSLGPWRRKLKRSTGLLLGAGGAGKAISGALSQSEVKRYYIFDQSEEKTSALVKLVQKRNKRIEVDGVSRQNAEKVVSDCDWVIQATSAGLKKGDPSPLSLKFARPTTWVVDLIYHHPTSFLIEAKERHLKSLNGLGMLLNQGVLSFQRWTGQKAPLKFMKRALLRGLMLT